MFNFSKKEQKIFASIILLIVLFIAYRLFNNKNAMIDSSISNTKDFSIVEDNEVESTDKLETINENEDIYIHISGRVKSPGLLVLEKGSRLIDAVKAAGGLDEDADLDKINLAKKLTDEEKIYIPFIGENTENKQILGLVSQDYNNTNSSLININTATQEELKTLPGIGEKTAEKIVKFRETQPFGMVEDLKEVPGIGDKKFNELRELICTN